MTLQQFYQQYGATLASDGIPLHFGDLKAEYHAAISTAILLDRSHEGRLELRGRDRFELLNRISTNNMLNMVAGEARPTIFTNANGRILERAIVYNWQDDRLLLLNGPGRGAFLHNFLKRQIFFNDQVEISDLSASHHVFTLHGLQANAVIQAVTNQELIPDDGLRGFHTTIADSPVFLGKLKPFHGSHWVILTEKHTAEHVWKTFIDKGKEQGLHPAGGITYNTLRIQNGIPSMGREISEAYIPLEIGLWDEVNFNKGCYTGQEIIARMDSRQQVARTLVSLDLDQMVDAPADLYAQGKKIGQITSSVVTPNDEIYAMAVVKKAHAQPNTQLETQNITVRVKGLLGTQPAWITG